MACGYLGMSETCLRQLDDWWDSLTKKCDYLDGEEIHVFYHCTSLNGKKSIKKDGKLIGGYTGLPVRAPIASNKDLKGVWLAMSLKELPRKSPYGTKRVMMKVGPLMTQLSIVQNDKDVDSDDCYDAPSDDEDKRKGKGKKKEKHKAKKQPKKKQKESNSKNKVAETPELAPPLLFFECAHYYDSKQYVRLILIRQDDDLVEWCNQTLKKIVITDNPFLCFNRGQIVSSTVFEGKHEVFVETLVVGDINLNTMDKNPDWDVVGTIPKAGFDPRLGVV